MQINGGRCLAIEEARKVNALPNNERKNNETYWRVGISFAFSIAYTRIPQALNKIALITHK